MDGNDDIPESDVDLFNTKDPRIEAIALMLQLLSTFCELELKDPYDRFDEDQVKVLSKAMRIIIKKQDEILKDK